MAEVSLYYRSNRANYHRKSVSLLKAKECANIQYHLQQRHTLFKKCISASFKSLKRRLNPVGDVITYGIISLHISVITPFYILKCSLHSAPQVEKRNPLSVDVK